MNKAQKILLLFIIPGFYVFVNTCSETSADSTELFANYEPHQWETAAPASVGINPEKLELALGEANLKDYLHSLLIVKDGKLIVEEYFGGYKLEEPHIVRSVSKSLLSVLIGFAVEDGSIESLDDSIYMYIPDLFTPGTNRETKSITIKNLIEMRSGIKRDKQFYSIAFNSANWAKTILEEELVSPPGSEYHYSTAATHILSIVLERAVNRDLQNYAYEKLFDPMDIEIAEWEKDPQGNYFGGNNMFFVPRDIALFGQIVLDGGSLNNKQIIPSEWLKKSLKNTRHEEGIIWGELYNIGYGYLWWLGELRGYKVQLAIGHGGQFIIIFPEVNLIIVTTSEAYIYWDEADEQERGILALIANYVLPSLNN